MLIRRNKIRDFSSLDGLTLSPWIIYIYCSLNGKNLIIGVSKVCFDNRQLSIYFGNPFRSSPDFLVSLSNFSTHKPLDPLIVLHCAASLSFLSTPYP